MIENFSEGEKRWRLTMIERLPRESGKNRKTSPWVDCCANAQFWLLLFHRLTQLIASYELAIG
ncbi:hypothetical protein D9T11_11260 [Enterobacter kobei]|nr:hypothetical protein D9T11_11260 [Enterobacter kobei]